MDSLSSMQLMPGSVLGPYEILAPLGAGGMGEVYRARDPRLGREVALKIVSASRENQADRFRRFEHEARAVAALNHPHVLAVYDVGSQDGMAYVVFELLEGQTLRERLARGPIPVRKALEYGVQVGRGLAGAHSRGVIHRDLKPENLFVTSDGQVKILDFGLAKLTEAPDGDSDAADTRTATERGLVLGTAGYLSPEQARGKKADARSDVFALGAVLYEMLAGRPAFGGDSTADRLSAVLHRDPPQLASSAREPVPPGLERVVRRCLEKDPEERFQTARDVAFALEALAGSGTHDHITEGRQPPSRRALRWATVVVVAALAAGAGLWAGRRLFERPVLRIAQLTFRAGALTGARFTSDERTVIYSASWDGKENETFLTRRDGQESRSLGLPPARLLSVSSRDELAILLTKQGEVGDPLLGTLARVPLAGGVPRPVLEDVENADWSPDGQELAVVRNVDGVRWLEYPLGTVLWRPLPCCRSAHGLRLSPGGDKVAIFADGLSIVDRSGGHRSFPLASFPVGLAWAPRGDAVWVTGSGSLPVQRNAILQISLDGSRREIFRAPGTLVLHDVAKSGAALLHHGSERSWVRAKARGGEERDLTGLRIPLALDISPDGSQVVIRDGADGKVYLCALQGGEPLLITHTWETTRMDAARLSPDGKWLLAIPSSGDRTARLVPIGAGEPRELPRGGMVGRLSGSFLDAGHIYWLVTGGEMQGRGFVQDVASGAVRSVTPEGVEALWSPLVKGALLGRRPDGTLAWFPVGGGEPRPTAARLPPGSFVFQTTSDGRAAFVSVGGIPLRIDRIDLVTGRRELWKKLAPPDLAGVVFMNGWVPMTPDAEAYAYHYLRVLQDLYLVEGLR